MEGGLLFPTLDDRKVLEEGVTHLKAADPKVRALIEEQGVLELKLRRRVFPALVESILSQQLNGHAADVIISRVHALFLPGRITPEKLNGIHARKLRKAGVSPQKLSYLRDLSARIVSGRLELKDIHLRSDEDVLKSLDEIKGVGAWTAQMILIFSLGRADVLPVDDFGIKKAVMNVYGLPELPDKKTIERVAEPWHPYSSLACLYLWRHKDSID